MEKRQMRNWRMREMLDELDGRVRDLHMRIKAIEEFEMYTPLRAIIAKLVMDVMRQELEKGRVSPK